MKYCTRLGLASAIALILTAVAGTGTASASYICSELPTNANPCAVASRWPIGIVVDISLKSATSEKLLSTEGTTIDTCTKATFKKKLVADTSSFIPRNAKLKTEAWVTSECTFPTTATQLGEEEIVATGSGNGTIKATSEFRVTINTVLFGSCVYGAAAGTTLGTVTGGKPATVNMNAVFSRLTGSETVCPETSKYTAEMTVTEPNTTMHITSS